MHIYNGRDSLPAASPRLNLRSLKTGGLPAVVKTLTDGCNQTLVIYVL